MIVLYNLFLRGTGLAARFLLIFALAAFLTPEDVGKFGLVAAIISYLAIVVGLEFYNFSVRAFIRSASDEKFNIVANQFLVHVIVYFVVIPVSYYFYFSTVLEAWVALIVLVVVVFEHAAQELNRLLNATGKQLQASFVLFCRTGLWVFWVVPVIAFFEEFRELSFVFLSWAISNVFALIISIYFLSKHIVVSRIIINFEWIKSGLGVAVSFMFGMLFLRLIFVLDKVFFDYYNSASDMGAYIYYVGGAVAIPSFVDAVVYVFRYPSLVRVAQEGGVEEFRSEFKQMLVRAVGASIVMLIGAVSVYFIANRFLEQSAYQENFHVGIILFFAMFFYSISMSYNYGLYALGRDFELNAINFVVVFVFATLVFVFGSYGVYVVPVAMLVSMLSLLFLKLFFYQKNIALQKKLTGRM